MKKKALMIGGFRKAAALAEFLCGNGYAVTFVCIDPAHAQKLAQLSLGAVICGDGTLPQVLAESDAQRADLAVLLMPRDEDNLVAATLCKELLQIKKTIALAKDAQNVEFFYDMGIDSVVCEVNSMINTLQQQAFLDGIATLVPISGGRIHVVEVPVQSTAPIVGKKLWEIELPADVIVGCILRREQSIVPRGDTRILQGDTLILIASAQQEMQAVRNLTGYTQRWG